MLKRSQTSMKKTPLKASRKSLQTHSKLSKGKGIRKKQKTVEQLEIEQMTRDADKRFYEEVWKARGPYSEVSGTFLSTEVNKACIHHIHSKARNPLYRYHPENVILLTIDEHATVEANPSRYPEINKRKEEFKEMYM